MGIFIFFSDFVHEFVDFLVHYVYKRNVALLKSYKIAIQKFDLMINLLEKCFIILVSGHTEITCELFIVQMIIWMITFVKARGYVRLNNGKLFY